MTNSITVEESDLTAEELLMPRLADTEPVVDQPRSEDEMPVYFELSPIVSDTISLQTDLFSQEEINTDDIDKEASNSPLSSGGYLVKPSQIYAEDSREQESNPISPVQKSVQADEPVIEMHLVVKPQKAAEEEPIVNQTQPIMMSSVEEPAMQDETDELRRRAMERIAKLRNLSFNINAADPNSEFETVPAYLRRNMEMPNQIANVENFYSNYVVKQTDNNQTEISTINTFLDGKKPD
jgi:cell division protein FtsZ